MKTLHSEIIPIVEQAVLEWYTSFSLYGGIAIATIGWVHTCIVCLHRSIRPVGGVHVGIIPSAWLNGLCKF